MRRFTVTLLLVIGLMSVPTGAGGLPQGVEVSTYKSGLAFPVDMAWVKGTKRVFFTEKNTGKIRILDGRNLRARPCVDLPVNSTGERGALGIVLHPNFKQNHWLYVYWTKASPLENRVTRFTVENRRCRNPRHVVKDISAASGGYHNGGQLEFGPDGHLYVTGPTVSSYDSVQRVDEDGRASVFFRGLGRPQGLAFDEAGNLYVAASYAGRRGVVRLSPDASQAELVVAGVNVVGLAFGPAGEMVVATNEAVYSLPLGIKGTLLK
jgi:glucose/arabinose dehydrogenase